MTVLRRAMVLLTLLVAGPTVRADDSDGAKVYKKVIHSVVWVHSTRDKGLATGSGTLVDREKRLVLTNYHVVEDNPRARVFFPYFRDGKPIAEKKYYSDRAKDLAIAGKVIAVEKTVDLALIQLDHLPAGVTAVPVAAQSVEPGQTVHSVGNTGKSDALWGYVPGKVRQVYKKEWRAKLDGNRILRFKAEVVETDSATNPGDSGGPLLNDKGELVGVTQGGAVDAQLVSTFVDVTEVQRLLRSEGVKTTKADEPKKTSPTGESKRDKPATVADGGKFFTEETVKKLQDAVNDLHAKQKVDLLVETFATVPKDDLEKVKGMKPDERTKYMREWATKRSTAETVSGFVVVVCKEPRNFYISSSPDVAARFPADFDQKLIKTLLDGLKNQKGDDAILEVAKMVKDNVKAK
ncbi:trypsin-like peptidase domain-containing protein [Limnoglobus roseus]|uniref:Serine protease n=1 Tax=Limnoglobus roseus TaxID=2598579 RepID=A0A5C1A586_9BACT|nr:trypsin-like peptidase domain-containing protein [Limnoglobus roseus]QEL13475.1 serine protease [Limnoglobus roseus]